MRPSFHGAPNTRIFIENRTEANEDNEVDAFVSFYSIPFFFDPGALYLIPAGRSFD